MSRVWPVVLVVVVLVLWLAGIAPFLAGMSLETALAAPLAQSTGIVVPTLAPVLSNEIPPGAFETPTPSIVLTGTSTSDAANLTRSGAGLAARGAEVLVLAQSLNVRAGPSTDYAVIGAAKQGETLKIVGQGLSCQWYQVRTTAGVEGWVSGDPELVRVNQACAFIPAAPLPPPAPTRAAGPVPTRASSGGQQGSLPTNKGCFLFQNLLGAEITLTFTAQGRDWRETWKLPTGKERLYCMDPGKYTYTLDAPPPWGSTNGILDVVAGKHYRFPISPAPE